MANGLRRMAGMLDVQAGEGRLVALLLAHSFFIGITRTLAEAAASSLFLTKFDAQELPYMYMGIALALTLTGLVYSSLQQRLTLLMLLTVNMGSIFVFLCVSYVLLLITNAQWPAFVLGVGFEVIWVLTSLEFWGLAGRIFTVRQGKRLFGLIGTGGVVATMVGGAVVPLAVRLVGTLNLLLLAAGSIAVALVFMFQVFRLFTAEVVAASEIDAKSPSRRRDLFKNRYIVLIFVLAALAMVGRYFVDNAFYEQSQLQYQGDGAQLASFFGIFLALSGVLTLASRVFLSGSLISRYGVMVGLLILPVMLLVGAGSVTVAGAILGTTAPIIFWLVAMTKMIDRVLRYSINRASVQVVYQPLPADQRLLTQTTSESIVEALAGGVAGIALLILHSALAFGAVQINYGLVVIVVGWIGAVVLLNREYVAVLMKALTSRKFGRTELTLEDSSSVAVLKRAVQSQHAGEVLYSLSALEGLGYEEYDQVLVEALKHSIPEVRQDVLERIERRNKALFLAALRERIPIEPVGAVRGTTVRVWAVLGGMEMYQEVLPYLNDPDPQVSSGAMVGLLRHGGVDGGTVAGQRLVKLLNSPNPDERERAAQVLGESGFKALHSQLARLLRDSETKVRRAALIAAGKLQQPELWSLVIEGLGSQDVSSTAVTVLLNAEASVTEALEKAFEVDTQPREMQIRLARVCGRVPGDAITRLLEGQMGCADRMVRFHVLNALRLRGYQAEGEAVQWVQEQVVAEIAAAAWVLGAVVDIAVGSEATDEGLLKRALEYEVEQTRKRVFLLLSFIYEPETIIRARENLTHPAREKQAYALEIIDVLLSQELKTAFFPLLDEATPQQRLERLQERFPQVRSGRHERLKQIIVANDQVDHWTKVCALYEVAKLSTAEFSEPVNAALNTPDPLVKEMALWTLHKIAPGLYRLYAKRWREGGISDDTDAVTQTVAEIEKSIRGEKMQLLTIEKVIILKTVSIFSETPDALLAEIATILKEVDAPIGQKIIEKGDVGNCLYIIAEGRVRVHDGERTITYLSEREVVGELALLDSEPRGASVTADEATLLLRLDQEAFYELIADYPDVVRGIIRVLSRRLRATNAG